MKIYLSFILILTMCANASAQKDSIYNDLTAALKNPDKVFKLDLSNKNLDAIPADVQKLKNLQELDISNNNITTVKNLTFANLKTVDLSNNKIQTIEKAALYQNAVDIKLDNNNLKKIDIDIFKLYNLENVTLSSASSTAALANSTVWENIAYLNSIGDTEALKKYENLKVEDYLKPVAIAKKDKLEPWELSGHAIGYNSGKDNIITAAVDGVGDNAMIGQKVKISLDQLFVFDYPGTGKHFVLFDFKVNNTTTGNASETVHFNQTRTAQENQAAGILSIPIFVDLNISKDGLVFDFTTINVKNENDENFLEIMDSNEMKKGVQLANTLNPIVPIITSLAEGIAKKIASRNKNKAVQIFSMGLDFSENKSKAKLRKGTYIVAQTGSPLYDWSKWEIKGGNVVSKANNSITLPYNYLVFSID